MTDEKRVTIADKVRFWEEQDRINRALIPRVLEIHEVVQGLHDRTANITGDIDAAEARVLERLRNEVLDQARDFEERMARISGDIAAAEARVLERLRNEVLDQARDFEERTARISGDIAAAEARVLERVHNEVLDQAKDFQGRFRSELIGRVRLVAFVALALSAFAFALSLYQAVR